MATLKISDLSVGDWVLMNGEPAKALRLAVAGRAIFKGLSGQIYGSVGGDIFPLPIVPEILEKNGWSNDGMYARLRITESSHLEYYYHEHRLRKYYCGVDEWQNHAKVTDITFAAHCYSVHQLQHALRLAGADKEINL